MTLHLTNIFGSPPLDPAHCQINTEALICPGKITKLKDLPKFPKPNLKGCDQKVNPPYQYVMMALLPLFRVKKNKPMMINAVR